MRLVEDLEPKPVVALRHNRRGLARSRHISMSRSNSSSHGNLSARRERSERESEKGIVDLAVFKGPPRRLL